MFSKKIVLHFPQNIANQPIVYKLVKDQDLEFNILKAFITPEEGGRLVLELSGEKKNYDLGMQYLKDVGVDVQPLSQDITRDASRCSHCSLCVPICPTGAFEVESVTREVLFHDDKCVACEQCVGVCPVQAIKISF